MSATVTDVVKAGIERVRNKLELYFESSDQISGLIKKMGEDKVEVSRYLYRMPFQQYRGGTYRKVNLDGGSYGAGSGMKLNALVAGYFTTALAYQVTDEQQNISSSKEQSTVNVFQSTLTNAMTECQVYDDIAFHGDGTGSLTNVSSANPTTTTLTFAGATDHLGVGKLREGMYVDIWDSVGTTIRANGPYKISNIDYVNKIVTFSSAPTALASGDQLSFAGVSVYGPSSPTSFSSTWPAGGLTNAAGLTGDSFRHGYLYANDATTTNYYLTILKSTVSQLMPTRVNASSALVFQHGMLCLDGLIQRRDKDVLKGLIGIAHMAQRQAVFNIGIAVSNWFRSSSDKMIDVQPSNIGYEETFEFCGVKCYLSKRQDRSRIDFINPSNWGRVQTHDTKFKDVGGQTVFPTRSSDALAAAVEFFVVQSYDFACPDPGAGAMIDSLSLPTGY